MKKRLTIFFRFEAKELVNKYRIKALGNSWLGHFEELALHKTTSGSKKVSTKTISFSNGNMKVALKKETTWFHVKKKEVAMSRLLLEVITFCSLPEKSSWIWKLTELNCNAIWLLFCALFLEYESKINRCFCFYPMFANWPRAKNDAGSRFWTWKFFAKKSKKAKRVQMAKLARMAKMTKNAKMGLPRLRWLPRMPRLPGLPIFPKLPRLSWLPRLPILPRLLGLPRLPRLPKLK